LFLGEYAMKIKLIIILLLSLCFMSCEEILLGPQEENSPKNNFEIMWKTLDENYALFPVKKVNWDSLHTFYGNQITSSTTDTQLWDILSKLIQQLDDGHVVLINKGISKIAQSTHIVNRKVNDFSLDVIKNNYLENIKTAGYGYFTYGKVKNTNIGYIYLSTFAGSTYGNGSDWAFDIDKIVSELYNCDGMIIDLRNNGGGLKSTGATIVSAFLDRTVTYFYQQEKTGPGHYDFGKPIPLTVSPRAGITAYTKKIALLTNRFSASGSEHFTQVMRYLPYAAQIGDTTLGCFGDIVGNTELPNGWVFWYPVRLTTTPEGFSPEGIGMIPDYLVENTEQDIKLKNDKVMNYAVEYLKK
jgi:carboxyl-terminal processing protease